MCIRDRDKPERRVVDDVNVDYVGFVIPDKFVVGYGLDYDQRFRTVSYTHLPFGDQEQISDVCVCCGKPAHKLVYWGKAY